MARLLTEIFDEIIDQKETFSSLDDLIPNPDNAQTFLQDVNTTSKVGVWRLWAWVVAFAIYVHEQIFVEHSAQVEERAQEIVAGTLKWYTDQAKLFQYGYDLEYNTTNGKYEYSDTTSVAAVASKIVTQAAAIESSGTLILKVAKGVSGSRAELSTAEKAAFDSYVNQFSFAGVSKEIRSVSPDYLKIAYTVEFDPLVLDSTGTLISDGATKPVEDAINDFIQGLDFDSVLRISSLTDAVQSAQGVINCVCDVAEGSDNDGVTYEDILAISTEKYQAYAGYLTIDPAFPLTSQITYTSA